MRYARGVAGRDVAPLMFRIVSIVLNGDSPVGTETKVRIQFVPSPDVARLTPMSRGAEPGCEGLSEDLPKTMAAATPARTTTIPTTKTTRTTVRFSDAGGGDGDVIAEGAGVVRGGTEPDNAVPHREQNRFANEFGMPQRGQMAVADVQALQSME